MKWNSQQIRGLDTVGRWIKRRNSNEPIFRLFGYAGTGKTTLARHLAEGVNGRVIFAAPTGKSANVLRQKGCPEADTIHKLIYRPVEKGGKGEFERMLRELQHMLYEFGIEYQDLEPVEREKAIESVPAIKQLRKKIALKNEDGRSPMFDLNYDSELNDCALLVLDEVSMIGGRIAEDILRFNVPILALGDPAQLPPVKDTGYFINVDKPDFMLTKIERNAKDNPIIRLATEIRNQERIKKGKYGQSEVIDVSRIQAADALMADQMLVGTNKSKDIYNARFRELKGYQGKLPVKGDKLLALRNDSDQGVFNGSVWYASADTIRVNEDNCYITAHPEEEGPEKARYLDTHTHYFERREDQLPWFHRNSAQCFNYGWSITVHKSQGSQWDDVLLFDQSRYFRGDWWKWLYTGVTRAAKRITIVQGVK